MMKKKNLKYHIQSNILAKKLPKKLEKSAYGFNLSENIFVGLPASNMKGKWVQLTVLPSNKPDAIVPIGDVGPWNGGGWNNKFDDPYWRKKQRPQAESGKDLQGKITDKAGIQISHKLWKLLGLKNKKQVYVNWHFVATPNDKQAVIVKEDSRNRYSPVNANPT